jgi:hypothetical protein
LNKQEAFQTKEGNILHESEIMFMHLTLKPYVAVLDFREDGCEPGVGRLVAERIAFRLEASRLFQVIARTEWLEASGGGQPEQKSCFHPGWAAQVMILAGAGAIVLGRVQCLDGGGEKLKAMMLDASGVVLASGERSNVDDLAKLLTVGRVASTARPGECQLDARIQSVHGSSVLVNTGRKSGIQRTDQIRIDLILQPVRDPYFQDEGKILGCLTARAGEAEVTEVGGQFVVLRYAGNPRLRPGAEVKLTKL